MLSLVRNPVAFALVALAALAVLAACNGGGGDETPVSGVTPPAAEESPAGQTPSAGAAEATVQMVSGTAFSPTELTIVAGTDVEITAENTSGFHSFAVYESEEAAANGEEPVAETEACSSPCSESVTVNLTAGEHFFRCEVHPNVMTGTITAE